MSAPAPIDLVLTRAEQFGVKSSGKGRWRMRGACHDAKRTLSVAIAESPDGAVLLHCFGGCSVDRILSVLDLQAHELFPPRAQPGRAAGARPTPRPYSVMDLVHALSAEMRVVWVLLSDLANGRQPTEDDRRRAGVARQRCLALIDELDHVS
jgi:hypothetical protein